MKNIFKYNFGFVLGIAITMLSASCSDWTDVENTDINQPNIADQNPALYAEYLENLREYKKSDHKCVIVKFNNKIKQTFSRSQHIDVLPDSVDYVSLKHPDGLSEWELEEIEKTRTDKGMKFIYTIDFDAIKLVYDNKVIDRQAIIDALEEGEEAPAELPAFRTFLVDSLQTSLALTKTYNYDGICFAYKGKSIMHMTEEEKVEYTSYHNSFIGVLKDWNKRNADKKILFEGYPQNLLDKSFLPICEFIIVPGINAGSKSNLTYLLNTVNVEGVPNDRFMVSTETTSLDDADIKTGYWSDGETLAVEGTALWVAAEYSNFKVVGMAIDNVGNDFFNSTRVYHTTRSAINTINPSLKN